MMYLRERAYCDRILRVDLSSGEVSVTPLPGEAMPLVLGGKGLGAWLLYHEMTPGIDPLSAENLLIGQVRLYHAQPGHAHLQRFLLWRLLGAAA